MTELCQLEGRALAKVAVGLFSILGRKLAIFITFFKITTSISFF